MNDEYEGQGGSYAIDASGERKLIERTREPGEPLPAEAEPPTLTEIIPHDQPADAGFFTPVAPAYQSTTTE
jgi:hypothetical protein